MSLAHLSSPKVKAKDSSHQKQQQEDTEGEKDREMVCFQGTWDSPRVLGTYRESTGLGTGSQLN